MSSKEPNQSEPFEQAAAEQPDESLESEVSRVRAELEAAKDLMLRSRAELDNYQKRVTRQIDEERKYANLPLLRDLLPVLDNVNRAIEAAEKANDAPSLVDGVKMVRQQILRALERHHCVPLDALHRPFDPHLHEAVMQQPSDQFPPNTVLQELRTGYQLHDRVVRPSQVIVSSASPGASRPGDGQATR
jgi:molecular chaperone GrpE